jgi:hypothetical protein
MALAFPNMIADLHHPRAVHMLSTRSTNMKRSNTHAVHGRALEVAAGRRLQIKHAVSKASFVPPKLKAAL